MSGVSVILPALNEETSIRAVLDQVRDALSGAGIEHEIIVVVDGATDRTAEMAAPAADRLVEHPQNLGYGRSLKTGILLAKHEMIAITDADGTYPVERLPELVKLADRYDMVVGARSGSFYRGGFVKRIARYVFGRLSEFAAGQRIPDINSGFRVFRRDQVLEFFPLISAGFSFTTTLTLAYLLNDLFVRYVSIEYHSRSGQSKVHHFRDALRALQILIEAILRCNPIKVFLLLAAPFFLAGVGLAAWAAVTASRVCALTSVATFCTCGVILGLGFLAVAVMPRQRIVNARACLPSCDDPGSRRDADA